MRGSTVQQQHVFFFARCQMHRDMSLIYFIISKSPTGAEHSAQQESMFVEFQVLSQILVGPLESKSLYISRTVRYLQQSRAQLEMFLSLFKIHYQIFKTFFIYFFQFHFMRLFRADATLFLKRSKKKKLSLKT